MAKKKDATFVLQSTFFDKLPNKQKVAWLCLLKNPTATFKELIAMAINDYGAKISKNVISDLKNQDGFETERGAVYQQMFSLEEVYKVGRVMLEEALKPDGSKDRKNILLVSGKLNKEESAPVPNSLKIQTISPDGKEANE